MVDIGALLPERKLVQEGPRDAKIILVGEAPGETEERTGRPFQGGAGELLNRMLDRTGIARDKCFITNLCHVRPPGNKFEWFFQKANQMHYLAGVLQLKRDIESIKPNIVVALGAQPLKALTRKDSIVKWRGSILESTLVAGVKVVATYHPAYCLRVYDYKAVSEFDLARVAKQSLFPEIKRPFREHHLHPDKVTRELVAREMETAEWLGLDIECWLDGSSGKWKLACVGFSDRADRSLVIHNDGPESIELIRRLCGSKPKKVCQNGTFDVTVLATEGIHVANFAWDTMLAHHSLYPECASGEDEMSALRGKKRQAAIAKGLAFQTSIYTEEPYYKDDGKLWKQDGDLKTFWLYNGRDTAVTREIRDVQHRELLEFGTMQVFEHEMALVPACMAATNRGIKIDLAKRKRLHETITKEIENLQKFIDHAAGGPFNAKSPKQVTHLLYETLGLPKKYKKGSSNLTGDKDAINELAAKHPHPVLQGILKVRERRDLIERYLQAAVDTDGRMRCSFDITGTRSGRLSSRASIYGSGTNLQNIPARKKEGEQIKQMFVADEGKVLLVRDYAQAEVWIVAYLARCQKLIDLLNDPNRDIHRETAVTIFGKALADITDGERYLAKRTVHSSNYGVGGLNLSQKVNEDFETTGIRINAREGDRLINGYFLTYPEIKANYWREVEGELRYSRTLNTPFGRKRTFYGRWDDKLLREAYSYPPQSTVGDLGGKAFVNCYNRIELGRPELRADLLLNVHDAIIMQAPIEKAEEVSREMEKAMAIDIHVGGHTIQIPSDCKVGFNWAKYNKKIEVTDPLYNPLGLHDEVKDKAWEWLASILK